MKNIIIIILCSIHFLHAQNDKFMGGTIFGFSEHDTRLYDLNLQDHYLAIKDGLGTYFYGVQVKKAVFNKKLLQLNVGIGINEEVITFARPFGHGYFSTTGWGTQDIKVLKFYGASTISIPVDINISPIRPVFLQLNILPSFDFHKWVVSQGGAHFSKWKPAYYATEINPGIGVRFSHWVITCNYRLYHFKKIDRVVFNGLYFETTNPPNPHLLEKYETYNPFKLWLSVNYTFNDWKWLTKKGKG